MKLNVADRTAIWDYLIVLWDLGWSDADIMDIQDRLDDFAMGREPNWN